MAPESIEQEFITVYNRLCDGGALYSSLDTIKYDVEQEPRLLYEMRARYPELSIYHIRPLYRPTREKTQFPRGTKPDTQWEKTYPGFTHAVAKIYDNRRQIGKITATTEQLGNTLEYDTEFLGLYREVAMSYPGVTQNMVFAILQNARKRRLVCTGERKSKRGYVTAAV